MEGILRDLGLQALINRFVEENLAPGTVKDLSHAQLRELGVHRLGDRVLLIDRCKKGFLVHRGRPKKDIPFKMLEYLIQNTFSYKEIAMMFQVSERTVANHARQFGIRLCDMADKLSDEILDNIIADVVCIHPNWGEKLHMGHLQSLGLRVQRERVREALNRVDPDGVDQRKRKALHRREYWVPGPNYIWHIDGNHKLIRWRIVIHGGIDGYSRIPVFIKCCNNNKADTVMQCFTAAITRYGLPQKIRSDKGGENVLIADYMIGHPDRGPGHYLTGRSVHNQRIERLWRDLFTLCTSTYYNVFYSMEEQQLLSPRSDIDLFVLHMVFLPRIQVSIDRFVNAWICHKVRTVGQSPLQLWLRGNHQGNLPAAGNLLLEPMAARLNPDRVMVPTTSCPINEEDLPPFQEISIKSMETENDLGQQTYMEIREAFLHLLQN